ncbi:MAG: abortive infection system toxin AbiGii family protein [Candidatus Gastranaerophilaceae bacterium]
MFVDFKKVFNNKPQTETLAPQILIDYLNKSLPNGVKYVSDKKGNCIITSDKESYTIGGFIFKPNEEQKKVLGNNFTLTDVEEYSYNTQQPIFLSLEKEGYITLNGEEFPIEKMAYNPMQPLKVVSGKLYMYPPKFPKPFKIRVGCDKYERELTVSRIPNNSISVAAFESNKQEPLYVKYFLNKKNHNLKLNMTFSLKNAKSIRDIVEATTIYNAYIEGKGNLCGQPLQSKSDDKAKKYDDNNLAFWEKVLKIENYLGLEFIPPNNDVDFETVCLVEQLFQNLIKKIPTRDNQIVNSISGNWDFESRDVDIKEVIGKPLYYEFEATSHIELFGIKIELPALLGLFNSVLSEHKIKGDKQELILVDESPEKRRYTSIMCFKTEEELKDFKTNDHDKMINAFHDAKKPQDYL